MCIHNSTFNFKKKLICLFRLARKATTTEQIMDAFREAFNLQHVQQFESLDVLEV